MKKITTDQLLNELCKYGVFKFRGDTRLFIVNINSRDKWLWIEIEYSDGIKLRDFLNRCCGGFIDDDSNDLLTLNNKRNGYVV